MEKVKLEISAFYTEQFPTTSISEEEQHKIQQFMTESMQKMEDLEPSEQKALM